MFDLNKLVVDGRGVSNDPQRGEQALVRLRRGGAGVVVYDGVVIGRWRRVNGNYPLTVTQGESEGESSSCGGLTPNDAVEYLLSLRNSRKIPGNVFPPAQAYILRVAEMTLQGDLVTARIYYNVDTTTGSSSASTPVKSAIGTINLTSGLVSVPKLNKVASLRFTNIEEIIAGIRRAINAPAPAPAPTGPREINLATGEIV